MKRKRLKCRYKVTSTHLYEDMHFVSQLGLDESECIHQRGYWNITDIRVCSEPDESKRWGKERSRLINPLGGMVGGQAWIMPAFAISDCLRSLLSHQSLQLDYHSPQNWMNFKPQIERILEFKFGFSFSGNKPTPRGGGWMETFYSHCCRWRFLEVLPPNLFHLRLKFHPGNLPVSLCLCFDSLSARCNLFCPEWATGMTARVSTQLINNDQIHHPPVWAVTRLMTRWGNPFRCKHE